MNDWYPSQDAKRGAFLANFVANIADACATLQLPASTFSVASTTAQAWLTNYATRQDAQRALDTAQAVLQRQATDTEKNLRAACQIKSTMNVPEDARPNRVLGQPEQRQYYAIYTDRDQPTGEQGATVSVVVGSQLLTEVMR